MEEFEFKCGERLIFEKTTQSGPLSEARVVDVGTNVVRLFIEGSERWYRKSDFFGNDAIYNIIEVLPPENI